MNQGQQANSNGRIMEKQICERIKSSGYKEKDKKSFLQQTELFPNNPIFTQQCCICKSIYNTPYKVDFILYDPYKHPYCLAFEIKWQEKSGSVDQKYPYTVQNIKEKFPCPAIIIIDGNGYRQGALNWLKQQIDDKLIGVFNIVDFFKWANREDL